MSNKTPHQPDSRAFRDEALESIAERDPDKLANVLMRAGGYNGLGFRNVDKGVLDFLIEDIGYALYDLPERIDSGTLGAIIRLLVEHGIDPEEMMAFGEYYFGEYALQLPCGALTKSLDWSLLPFLIKYTNNNLSVSRIAQEYVLLTERFSPLCYKYLDYLIDQGADLNMKIVHSRHR